MSENSLLVLAKNIKQIRKELNESQMEFAMNCGVSEKTMSLLECGIDDPKNSTLEKIHNYTNYEIRELYDPYLILHSQSVISNENEK